MDDAQIKLTIGPVATLTLARPDARNAMTEAMGLEIARAVDVLNASDEVRVVLVRGEGVAFAAGGDFDFIEARARAPGEENRRVMGRFYRLFLSIRRLRAPSIAVLHGAAVGAGCCFALACDLRLAASGAKLGLNFVRIGLHPGMGATYLLPRLVGPARAAELLLTGRLVPAEEALALGLVNAVHPPEGLLAAATALAEEIAKGAPLAVQQCKASLQRALERSLDGCLEEEAYAQAIDYASADLLEGVAAFREKRAPRFSGR